MKRIIVAFVLCLVTLLMCACSQNENEGNNLPEVKYETADELAEKFMSVCKDGNVGEMYNLYYDDMLDDMYERVKNNLSREQFDSYIKSEMMSFVDYELTEYGEENMQTTSSPLFNLNYIFYRATGTETDFTEDMVTSCANIRLYSENGNATDHVFAEINGSWYVVL